MVSRAAGGLAAAGIQMSGRRPTTTPKNSRGSTPTMVAGWSSTVMRVPTIDGARLNRLCQYAQLTTATVAASCAPISRPAAGATPRAEKKLPVT